MKNKSVREETSSFESKSKYDEKSLYVSSSATPTSNKKTEVNSSKDSDSDDGWSISDQSDKTVTVRDTVIIVCVCFFKPTFSEFTTSSFPSQAGVAPYV